MVHLVQTYYKSTNFCVISPYDAQRAAIEKGLQNAKLPWDSVYNVDSFQGSSVFLPHREINPLTPSQWLV